MVSISGFRVLVVLKGRVGSQGFDKTPETVRGVRGALAPKP